MNYMVVLNYSYKTALTREAINDWVKSKSERRAGFFKSSLYETEITEDGFRIRKNRRDREQAYFPQIIGKFDNARKSINIKIRPSTSGIIFSVLYILGIPVLIFTTNFGTIQRTPDSHDFVYWLSVIGVSLLIIIPLIFIFVIGPNYGARDWMEEQLQLTDRQKISAEDMQYR